MKFYAIFKREIFSYISSPTLYVVFTIWCLLSGYFFYTDVIFYNWKNSARNVSLVDGMWLYYFNDLRLILVFSLPLITMRAFAEEKRSGTIELLNTYPIRDGEIVAGKVLSSFCIFLTMLALSFVHVLLLGLVWGYQELLPVLAGYLGLTLLGSSLITIGIFISSLTENQFVAGLGTMASFIFFWFFTWNQMIASENVIGLLVKFSLFDRVIDFFRGMIELRHVTFFVLVDYLFISLTFYSLRARMWTK